MNKEIWIYFIMMLAMHILGWIDAKILDKTLIHGIISIVIFGGLGLYLSQLTDR